MKKRVLIIEDEKNLINILSIKFKLEEFEVLASMNGESCIDKIKKWQPNLILFDVNMMSADCQKTLKDLTEKENKIPIIVISDSEQDMNLKEIKELEAVDYIIRDQITPDDVMEKVKKIFSDSNNSKNEKEDKTTNANIKVLLVEDDLFLRDICYKKLIKEGFDVCSAIDGEEAIKMLDKCSPDIILLDIILPAIDGFEVLKQIRSHKNAVIKNTPVIMLTNLGQEEDIKKALALKADDYLIKAHFTTEEIVKKIKSRLAL